MDRKLANLLDSVNKKYATASWTILHFDDKSLSQGPTMVPMLEQLTLVTYPAGTTVCSEGHFELQTCQRSLLFGFGLKDPDLSGASAYEYLLQIVCGLKSKILAEQDIAAQFKAACQRYKENPASNPLLQNILERLSADSKRIRTEYLLSLGGQSYAGIVRQILKQESAQKILIKGSGQLACDLIKLLKKHHNVYITARNSARLSELVATYGVSPIDWMDVHLYRFFSHKINTIGVDQILFDESYFDEWSGVNQRGMYIDLGIPSVLDTRRQKSDGVWRLEDVLSYGEGINNMTRNRVNEANKAIKDLVEKRKKTFALNYPFGWEELMFA